MADIKGIELASDIYGLEDETARDNVETNTSAIGTLANLETTAKTNLVAAINEVNSAIDRTHTQKTVSFASGISVQTGDWVDYIPGIKALLFYVGGSKSSNLTEGDVLFTVNVTEPFTIGGWGTYLPIPLRNLSSGAMDIGIAILSKSGDTITAVLQKIPNSGSFNEFRMLQEVVFSL